MPGQNKFYLIIPCEIIFLFFILIILPTIFIKERPGINQISYNKITPLTSKESYTQEVITDKNNLNSISVLLKNPELKNSSPINLAVLNSNKETLQTLKTSGISVGDPSWIKFKFPPIKSQKGDIFYIKVTSDNDKDNSLYIYGEGNNNINFKTTFTALSLKESFKDNLKQQINNFQSRNIFQTTFYLVLLFLTNLFIFI
jgi:hypothetical protein